jgi:SAM-dependent methyltransferase
MIDANAKVTSYSSRAGGPLSTAKSVVSLMRQHLGDPSVRVATAIAHLRRVEQRVFDAEGLELRSLRMLDVGAGQRLVQMRYFDAWGNDVVGVDRDCVVQGFDPAGYVKMARTNGALRVAKTLGRKALLVDARFTSEFYRQLGIEARRSQLDVRQMDAAQLSIPDRSFDFVYSTNVLQHVEQPERVLAEIARVVRPSGVVYVYFLPYTSRTGCLDIRLLGGREPDLPPWAHLRPRYATRVRESAYLNRLPVTAWRTHLAALMPGSTVRLAQPNAADDTEEALQIKEQGELLEFELEDLLTFAVSVVWRKPSPHSPPANTGSLQIEAPGS